MSITRVDHPRRLTAPIKDFLSERDHNSLIAEVWGLIGEAWGLIAEV